jgi:predicted nucleic acid-binding Zn ribbon protein
MPIYDYQCVNDVCVHVEENVLITTIQREEEERPCCVKCKSEMRRVMGGRYLIHYNTTGFYQTDVNSKNTQ